MKKTLLSFTSVAAFAALVSVPVASASAGLTVDTPQAGSPVGNSVTFSGYASVPPGGDASGSTDGSKCSGPTSIKFTDSTGRVGYADVTDSNQGSLQLKGTRWTLPMDLSNDVVSQAGGSRTVVLKPGRLTVAVSSQAAGCAATVSYNYQPTAATASPTDTPTPTPTPTMTPSASASPLPEQPKNTISPVVLFLIGALIGGALVSLSEVSALSYLKKHPRRK